MNSVQKSVLSPTTLRKMVLLSMGLLVWGISTCPAETTKVFLLAGQSNMVGWSSNSGLPQELQQPRPDIQVYWNGVWDDLQPGLGGNSSYFGPEITFGRDIVDAQPGESVVFVKYSVSGTSLWNDWRATDGVEYTNFMNAVDNALLSISEPEIIGMIWMQGESDAYSPHSTLEYAQNYEQNLTDFIQHIRTDFDVPDLPFVIGQISQSPVWVWAGIVRQAQLNVSQTVPNTTLVITDELGLKADGMHYDANGTVTLGTHFANAAKNLVFSADSAFSGSEDAVLSWYYTIPEGDNRALVVGICGKDDDPCDLLINSVTYNNINMNEIPGSRQLVFADGNYIVTELFYLLEDNLPTADSYKLEINFSGNVDKRGGGAVTLNDVEQQSPHAVATGSIEDANGISTEVVIQTDGAWVVDAVASSSTGVFAADSNQIAKFNLSGDNITITGSTKPVSIAGPTTINWSLSGGNSTIAHSIAAFETSIKTISGHVLGSDDDPIEGVAVAVDAGGANDTTDANGHYEVPVIHNWSGKVIPIKDGYLFGPSERAYSGIITDMAGQDYKDLSTYDLDTDGLIDWGDIRIMIEHWLETGEDIPGDFYKDQANIVDFMDLADFANVWQN